MAKQFLNDPFVLEMGTKTFSHRLIYQDRTINLVVHIGGKFSSERSFTINKTHTRKLLAGLKRDYPNIQTAKELFETAIGLDEDALIDACVRHDATYEAKISI